MIVNIFCSLGECTCSAGYFGDDCSVALTFPPVIDDIPDFLCDLLRSDCKTVVMNGDGFLQIGTLACRVQKLASQFNIRQLTACNSLYFL